MVKLEKLTLQEIILKSTLEYAAEPVVTMVGGTPLTYAEFRNAIQEFSRLLATKYSITKGNKVALLSENRPEWGIAYFAITSLGAVVVPILTEFTQDQVRNILIHAECTVAVVSKKLSEKIKGVENIGRYLIEDLRELSSSTAQPFEFPEVHESDLAAIIYTSGTTGNSKGVMLTQKNLASNAVASRTMFRMHKGDRLLSILPLAHTYECTLGFLAPVYQGACMYYIDKPPTATVLLPALKSVRPTVMLTVPLIMEKIYRNSVLPKLEERKIYANPFFRNILIRVAGKKLKKTFGGRMRFFGIGGAALSPDVEEFLKKARFPYAIGYGLTETSPLVAGTKPSLTHLRATGPALHGVEMRIAPPENGASDGEIQVRGPNVMAGYYKDPVKTAECFTADGWFRTGDTGKIDEKNRVYVRGRLKTMILGPSGENIYPEEIEALINKSNFVQESLVYGEPSGGISALVMLKPEALERFSQDMKEMSNAVEDQARALAENIEEKSKEMLENMRKEVNGRLAAFSRIGKVILQHEPFEKTPTQKIKRHFYPKSGK